MQQPNESDIDLREAINAVSDVIQNRPRPLREFDQIYMKAADMVLQSEFVARWARGKRVAFIGDGDAISVCVAYLQKREIIPYGPSKIAVFDFDERICNAVKHFAERENLEHLESRLYNVIDSMDPGTAFDCFYTNPPWGASNDGLSVRLFARRGMEAVEYSGEGMIVIADDRTLEWPQKVLANTQRFALDEGFFIERQMPLVHQYHLDEAPNLRSCNLVIKALPNIKAPGASQRANADELEHFYGREQGLKVRYVREKARVDYGKALDAEYHFEEDK